MTDEVKQVIEEVAFDVLSELTPSLVEILRRQLKHNTPAVVKRRLQGYMRGKERTITYNLVMTAIDILAKEAQDADNT